MTDHAEAYPLPRTETSINGLASVLAYHAPDVAVDKVIAHAGEASPEDYYFRVEGERWLAVEYSPDDSAWRIRELRGPVRLDKANNAVILDDVDS
jgi:uncharacterized protein YkuJ